MTNPLSKELYIVLCCIVCGELSGIWYDFFKALRKLGLNSKIQVMIQDALFWIGETAIIFFMLFYANNGKLRWYEFFFVVFGFCAYRYLLSKTIVLIFEKLMHITIKGISIVFKCICVPLKKTKNLAFRYRKSKIARFLRRIFKRQQ